ncbi:SNARE complex subunit [Metarhizium album ARSEF 1941]|uniref:SNARE complex subunit n=1 Tax=Metarhizium album (strain ARSEF 1941) TaxID=1081103 RepID=A0A0B2X475_METAS|nr:SNARE complex subunit [Metarhizium album ARSEF 1941]KHO00220.1 SNARE complex subunit [Metarhizium album ARSEF 1941]
MSNNLSYGQGGHYSSHDVRPSNAGNNYEGSAQDAKIQEIKEGIRETQATMKTNLEDIAGRGDKLHSMEHQTAGLADSSQQFRRGANRVRKQMWWKDMKMRICLIAGVIILLLVIIIPSVVATRR